MRVNWQYAARRVAHGAVLLAVVSVLAFVLIQMAPGDFFSEARMDPRATPETIANWRQQAGMSESMAVRYWQWVRSAAMGDFGPSLAYHMPVAELVWPRCRNTAALTGWALLAAWAMAIPLGVWSASGRASWLDRACSFAGTSLLVMPDIVLATLLLLAAARTGKIAVSGSMILPVMCLTAGLFPVLFRHVRAAIKEVASAPFVRAAQGLGIRQQRLLFRYLLPAAANPLISLVGLSVAGLFSSSLLVEVMFGWPGLGPLFLDAISARDPYVILAVVMLSATALVAANLAADILLLAADPRIHRRRRAQ